MELIFLFIRFSFQFSIQSWRMEERKRKRKSLITTSALITCALNIGQSNNPSINQSIVVCYIYHEIDFADE